MNELTTLDVLLFSYLIACALSPIFAWVLDKITAKQPVKLADITRDEMPEPGSKVQFRTKKGRRMREGRVIGIDHTRGYPRVRVMMTSIPGNNASFFRRREDLIFIPA